MAGPKYQLFDRLRDEEYQALHADIEKRGVMVPVEVDESGNILDGHHRAKIANKLQRPYKTIVRKFKTEQEKREHVIKLNMARRHMEPYQWGNAFKMLVDERGAKRGRGSNQGHSATIAECAEEVGVPERTARHRMAAADTFEALPKPMREKVKSRETTLAKVAKEKSLEVRRNRVIQETRAAAKEQAVIILGDCLEAADSAPLIDLLITDPPYFTAGDFTGHVSAYLARVKPTGQAYVFASAAPDEVAAYLLMDRHKMLLEQVLVWNYNNTGQRQPNDRYNSNFQLTLYFRGPKAAPINKPSDGTHQYACQTVNAPDGRMGDRFHEWQKPIELIERYILNSSRPGDFVCDPFAGTGTTLLAAAKHGRRATGYDNNKLAVATAVKRGCVYGHL